MTDVIFLTTKYHLTIGNLGFKQDTGVPMERDTTPYWENLFIFFKSKYVQQLMSKGSQ